MLPAGPPVSAVWYRNRPARRASGVVPDRGNGPARRHPRVGVTAYAWHVTVTAADALLEDLNPQQRSAIR